MDCGALTSLFANMVLYFSRNPCIEKMLNCLSAIQDSRKKAEKNCSEKLTQSRHLNKPTNINRQDQNSNGNRQQHCVTAMKRQRIQVCPLLDCAPSPRLHSLCKLQASANGADNQRY